MKKLRRAIFAVLSAVLLTLWLPALPQSRAADDVFFTGINDRLLTLDSSSMPVVIDRVIYVPYNVFHDNDLGSLAFYHRSEQLVQILRDKTELLFNLADENSSGTTGVGAASEKYIWKAYVRDGIPFVPALSTANYLGLNYSRFPTDLRTDVIRVTSGAEVYSDSQFAQAGYTRMSQALTAYNAAKPSAAPTPSPTIYVPPVNTPGPGPGPSPVYRPSPSPEPTEAHYGDVTITLNIIGVTEETGGYTATYWVSAEEAAIDANLLRKLRGEGNLAAPASSDAAPYLREVLGFLNPAYLTAEDGELPEAMSPRTALRLVRDLNHGSEAALWLNSRDDYTELYDYLRSGLYNVI
ncbi:MAG: hypothetical protein LBN97_00285 [Oscillospiraceae bacterium]|jgi:hypothetical protein|nr:hypothetical protein [Oscillospiraceae bacterium]